MIHQEVAMDISSLFRQGYSGRQIARSLGISRNTVKKYLSGDETAFKPRNYKSKLDPFKDYLECVFRSNWTAFPFLTGHPFRKLLDGLIPSYFLYNIVSFKSMKISLTDCRRGTTPAKNAV